MLNTILRRSLLTLGLAFPFFAAAQNEPVYSYLEIYDLETRTHKVIKEFPNTVEAPNWTPDGKWLVINTGGKIYKVSPEGGDLIQINTGGVERCNNDHVLSKDGKYMGFSSNGTGEKRGEPSYVYFQSFEGGDTRQVTPTGPSYLHGISPDGKTMVYHAIRTLEDGTQIKDIYSIPVKGGQEKRLTTDPALDDGPEYTPDGKYIWFNSARSGRMQVWRMKPNGKEQTQMTTDESVNAWFPHVSPDGKKVVYICYKDYEIDPSAHLPNLNVELRLMSAEGGDYEVLAYLFGGQGTINVNSWSPDSKKFAYVSYRTRDEIEAPQKEMNAQLYSLRSLIGTPELFAKNHEYVLGRVRQMGFTGVEAASYEDGKFSGLAPAEFRKTIEAAGLKIVSSHASRLLTKEEVASGNVSAALKWWEKCIADHKAAGIPMLVMAIEQPKNSIQELKVMADYLNTIGEMCSKAGIKFGYHNHAGEFRKVGDTTMMDYLLENTKPENVFFEMDVWWVVKAGASPVDYMRKYRGRFNTIHIKDRNEVGQSGMVGFDAIFANFRIAGTEQYIVEVEDASTPNVLRGLRQCAIYIRKAPFVQ